MGSDGFRTILTWRHLDLLGIDLGFTWERLPWRDSRRMLLRLTRLYLRAEATAAFDVLPAPSAAGPERRGDVAGKVNLVPACPVAQ